MTTEGASEPVRHVKYYGDERDGGCLTCDECDHDEMHDGPCNCDHVAQKAEGSAP